MAREVVFTLTNNGNGGEQCPEEAVKAYHSARSQVETAKQNSLVIAREAFAAGRDELFAKLPLLNSFGWQPLDNGDGSSGISSDLPDINGRDGLELEEEGESPELDLQKHVSEFL